ALVDISDRGNPPICNRDVGLLARGSRAVDNRAVSDHQVVRHRALLPSSNVPIVARFALPSAGSSRGRPERRGEFRAASYSCAAIVRRVRLGGGTSRAAMVARPGTAGAVDTTFHVTNTNDDGDGSLRKALSDAASNDGDDTVDVEVSGTITLTT